MAAPLGLPAASTARTAKVWRPSAVPLRSAVNELAHGTHGPPSIEHSSVPSAGPVKYQVGDAPDWAGGPLVIDGAPGAARSSTNASDVASPSLPAGSTARTAKVWRPSAAPVRSGVKEPAHDCHGPPSIEHQAVAPSSTANVHVGVSSRDGSGGSPVSCGGAGSTVSRRTVLVAATPRLPASSKARTEKRWSPSAAPARSAVNEPLHGLQAPSSMRHSALPLGTVNVQVRLCWLVGDGGPARMVGAGGGVRSRT